ncbi:hypothetical protein ACFPM0_30610 [Pseudonocardia sulfidoxydans]|uniref:hypothetical protein n=1 Tax=Pseudonocardia sulfidoxydans TaxID=54011 RepID=UPI003608B55D
MTSSRIADTHRQAASDRVLRPVVTSPVRDDMSTSRPHRAPAAPIPLTVRRILDRTGSAQNPTDRAIRTAGSFRVVPRQALPSNRLVTDPSSNT